MKFVMTKVRETGNVKDPYFKVGEEYHFNGGFHIESGSSLVVGNVITSEVQSFETRGKETLVKTKNSTYLIKEV